MRTVNIKDINEGTLAAFFEGIQALAGKPEEVYTFGKPDPKREGTALAAGEMREHSVYLEGVAGMNELQRLAVEFAAGKRTVTSIQCDTGFCVAYPLTIFVSEAPFGIRVSCDLWQKLCETLPQERAAELIELRFG